MVSPAPSLPPYATRSESMAPQILRKWPLSFHVDGILPIRCHLHSPCFRLLSNRYGGAPWYTLNTLYSVG